MAEIRDRPKDKKREKWEEKKEKGESKVGRSYGSFLTF